MLEQLIMSYVSGYLVGALLSGRIVEVIKEFFKWL